MEPSLSFNPPRVPIQERTTGQELLKLDSQAS